VETGAKVSAFSAEIPSKATGTSDTTMANDDFMKPDTVLNEMSTKRDELRTNRADANMWRYDFDSMTAAKIQSGVAF
jgi:hypothetical protein